MCNVNVLEQSSKLKLPYCYVEVTDDEMAHLGGTISFWGKVEIMSIYVGISVVDGILVSYE